MKKKTKKYFNLNKKSVAGVVTAVIMIALVIAAAIIVWVVVTNLVSKQLEEAESCFMIFGKVTINNRYTCYDFSLNEFHFSINMGDVDIDEVLVSISAEGTTKSFKISKTNTTIENLVNYPDGSEGIKLPDKNAGATYIYNMTGGDFSVKPDAFKIAPIVSGKQCDVSDSISDIDNCLSLA